MSRPAVAAAAAPPARSWRDRVAGLRSLPRETRDVLFMLALIGWTLLPHLPHVPPWCVGLVVVVLGARAALALRAAPLPSRALLIALLALAIGLTLHSHTTLFGKDAGITLLVVLMVLKTLELRARRDALVVFFLGFFLVLTTFLHSQSLLIAAAALVSTWGLLTALVLAHMPVGQPALKEAARLAARATLFGVPLMIVLFLLFPRLGPLWALPQDAAARTGLSGVLALGEVAELANDDSIAFRVRFDGERPPSALLYWRGPVLSQFDGDEWRPAGGRRGQRADELPPLPALPPPSVDATANATDVRIDTQRWRPQGRALRYEMTLEPLRLPLLPLLELTPDLPGYAPQLQGAAQPFILRQRATLDWATATPVNERLRLSAQAWPRFTYGPLTIDTADAQAIDALRAELQLPEGRNPRTIAWAQALARQPALAGADAERLAQAVLAHVRQSDYRYSLSPGLYGTRSDVDTIDEFWTERRIGFCEHFASAFVVVMRALGVPARIVTGYQGADTLPQDGWTIVRQSHAHAWAEIWQQGVGWQRIDPTAAVAPERVERGAPLRPPPGLMAQALGNVSPELLARLRAQWEMLDNRWNQWVMNYSRSAQASLLEVFGFESASWQTLSALIVGFVGGAALAAAGWALWDQRQIDPWQRLLQRLRARLAALGIAAAAHEPPRTLAARVRRHFGADGNALADQLDQLDALRYGPGAAAGRRAQRAGWRSWWREFARSASAMPARTGPPGQSTS